MRLDVGGRFAGKVALVTGAAQGIGRTVALRLAAEGAQVALVDRSELVHEVAAEAGSAHTLAVTADLETFAGATHCVARDARALRPAPYCHPQCGRHDLGPPVCRIRGSAD